MPLLFRAVNPQKVLKKMERAAEERGLHLQKVAEKAQARMEG